MKFEILSNENIKLNCLVHRMDWQILSNENIKFNCLVHRMDWQPVNYKRKDEEVHLIMPHIIDSFFFFFFFGGWGGGVWFGMNPRSS